MCKCMRGYVVSSSDVLVSVKEVTPRERRVVLPLTTVTTVLCVCARVCVCVRVRVRVRVHVRVHEVVITV